MREQKYGSSKLWLCTALYLGKALSLCTQVASRYDVLPEKK